MTDVFISYKREERVKAKALAEALVNRGFDVWWDIELLPGEDFSDEIMAIIAQTKAAIVLWSRASVASRFVRDEARRALRRNKLIPVRLDDCELPLGFGETHTHDLGRWNDQPDDSLLDWLITAVEQKTGKARKSPGTEKEVSERLHLPDSEALFWRSIIDQPAPSHEEFHAYLDTFGENGLFARLAQVRIQRLQKPSKTGASRSKQGNSRVSRTRTAAPDAVNRPRSSEDLSELSVKERTRRISEQPHGARFSESALAPEMVVIDPPEKTYQMGSPAGEAVSRDNERPQHPVTIKRKFALGQFAVTFEEYEAYCRAIEIDPPENEGWGRGRRPVINVSWDEVQDYLDWLNGELGLAEGTYRLPSEAKWEFACRAGTARRYAFGDELTKKRANFGENVGKTVEVGSYRANGWGLHDMHGNVWEWCADPWHENYTGAPDDGSVWLKSGDEGPRILRGGSWDSSAGYCRSAMRGRGSAGLRDDFLGFRAARTLRD